MSERKYDAFISYRHLELDKAVAIRLQYLLETIKPPRGLQCRHTRKISRIFRDESELPTSGDLGNDIITALDNSRYLVVLCTPKLKESKWCMREIEYFKEKHNGRINNILPILVDGDHIISFPDILRWDTKIILDEAGNEIGRELVEVEPLACNIMAGGDVKNTLKKLKTEYLRIAAPVLGCGFDDLYRRHRRRRIQRIVSTVSAAVFLTTVSSTIFTIQNRNVVSSRDNMYIELSQTAYLSGRVQEALDYALNALAPRGFLMPDTLPAARLALTNALGVYDLSEGYKPLGIFSLPQNPFSIALSPLGNYAAAVYAFDVTVFDIQTSEIIASLPVINSALAEAVFLSDEILLFAGESGLTAYHLTENQVLWTGEPATAIAVSEDKSTIATIFRDEDRAIIYNIDGSIRYILEFNGSHQRAVYHDIFANPGDNLFELNHDGSMLALNFEDNPLMIYELFGEQRFFNIPGTDEYSNFTGGFHGNYFAFSASGHGLTSVAVVINIISHEQLYFAMDAHREFIVRANNQGIFISNANINDESIVLEIEPGTGNTLLAAFSNDVIVDYAVGEYGIILATDNNRIELFDRQANRTSDILQSSDFVKLSGSFGVGASRNTEEVMLFMHRDTSAANVFEYDALYRHGQTRINTAGTRVMRFSHHGFRLYDIGGSLINQTELPEAMRIFNLQFSHLSANLAVIYPDALRIYSGENGALMFEAYQLRSVFFSPYGISILDADGALYVVDIDTAQAGFIGNSDYDFAAYAGMLIDSAFLSGRELIGIGRRNGGYVFAVSEGNTGTVYNQSGSRLFDIETGPHSEAFFTEGAVVVRAMHGNPIVYNMANGNIIRELAEEAYLTYVHKFNGYTVVEYIRADGERFGVLKDGSFQSVALLPDLTDLSEDLFFFDYGGGIIRESRMFSLEELKALATEAG